MDLQNIPTSPQCPDLGAVKPVNYQGERVFGIGSSIDETIFVFLSKIPGQPTETGIRKDIEESDFGDGIAHEA